MCPHAKQLCIGTTAVIVAAANITTEEDMVLTVPVALMCLRVCVRACVRACACM